MIKVIAFYLPQFHPTEENDIWWGKGFTEWTNVGKAKPLFRKHYQPRIPADLGYYDLRLHSVKESQADLARKAGISAFCYYHYWFGNKKQLLQEPLKEVVRKGTPDFPFCLCWANHSWENKNWNSDASSSKSKMLIKQEYPGKEDVDLHFNELLSTFKDNRYYKVHGKLLFMIYDAINFVDLEYFMNRWQFLAKENQLPGFFFISYANNIEDINILSHKTDAVSLSLLMYPWGGLKGLKKRIYGRLSSIFKYPFCKISYKNAIKYLDNDIYQQNNIYPVIIPNWDHSPRSGYAATIYYNSTPELFYKHAFSTFKKITNKKEEDRIVFLKSWNEWGEGNYMEPDLRYGKGYINALKQALNDSQK